LLLFTT